MQTRRKFIQIVPIAGASLLVGQSAFAQAKLEESDAQAKALGYSHDATKVDKTKQTKYAAGQNCHACQLFQGKPTDAWGGCPLFAGKQVNGNGWCSAWVKKA
jgi:hypothetical protein